MIPMIVPDATTTVATVDTGATNPAMVIVPVLTPLTPVTPTRAAPRIRLTPTTPERALTRRLPATVTAPLDAAIPAQDATWQRRAMHLAYEHDATCAATWIGLSARGSACYRVPSSRRSAMAYRVSFLPYPLAQTVADGRYLCECPAGRRGVACWHAGAALLLAERRAQARESVALAQAERMNWAWATHRGGNPDEHVAFYLVARGRGRSWELLRVVWDTQNHVAIWCDCGAHICAHIGAVAQRAEKERADHLRYCQRAILH